MELTEDDLLISTESAAGYVSASDKGITVALNTKLTPELIDEGIGRELISKLQTMRKEAGFEVTDRIDVYYTAEGQTKQVLASHREAIAAVVLADSVQEGSAEGYTKDWELGKDKVTLTVVKR